MNRIIEKKQNMKIIDTLGQEEDSTNQAFAIAYPHLYSEFGIEDIQKV